MSTATCAKLSTCSVCGHTEGSLKAHTWTAATCTAPKTCSVCKATEGKANGHKYDSDTDLNCNTCGHERGKWSDYGAWSAWQDTSVTETIYCDVETQQAIAGYNKKTQWFYSRYYGKSGSYYLAWHEASGICLTYEETGWLDYPLEYKSYTNKKGETSWGYGMNVLDNKYIHWYNEKTREVDDKNSPIYKTQYRYRTRTIIWY